MLAVDNDFNVATHRSKFVHAGSDKHPAYDVPMSLIEASQQ